MENFTKYPEAKRYFEQLSNLGLQSSIDILNEYQTIKLNAGDFIAGMYLRNVYAACMIELENLKIS